MKSRDAFCDARTGKEWHELALNTQWLGSDKDGNLHCATAYCFHCGRSFEVTEFRPVKE